MSHFVFFQVKVFLVLFFVNYNSNIIISVNYNDDILTNTC